MMHIHASLRAAHAAHLRQQVAIHAAAVAAALPPPQAVVEEVAAPSPATLFGGLFSPGAPTGGWELCAACSSEWRFGVMMPPLTSCKQTCAVVRRLAHPISLPHLCLLPPCPCCPRCRRAGGCLRHVHLTGQDRWRRRCRQQAAQAVCGGGGPPPAGRQAGRPASGPVPGPLGAGCLRPAPQHSAACLPPPAATTWRVWGTCREPHWARPCPVARPVVYSSPWVAAGIAAHPLAPDRVRPLYRRSHFEPPLSLVHYSPAAAGFQAAAPSPDTSNTLTDLFALRLDS